MCAYLTGVSASKAHFRPETRWKSSFSIFILTGIAIDKTSDADHSSILIDAMILTSGLHGLLMSHTVFSQNQGRKNEGERICHESKSVADHVRRVR
jgi:hypothetical protein